MNWKGFGSKQLWPDHGTKENHEKPVRTAGVLTKIKTEHLLNMTQEHCLYANPFSFTFMTEMNVTVCSLQESMKWTYIVEAVSLQQYACFMSEIMSLILMWFLQEVYAESSQENFILYIPVHITSNLHDVKMKLHPKTAHCCKNWYIQ
jgi:hypothetical protein